MKFKEIFMVGILIALLAGLLMSVQGVFNTRVMNSSSMWVSNAWVHASGLVVCLIIWFFTGRKSFAQIFTVNNKLYLLGGVLGALIIYTVIRSISGLGPCYATMLILLAQLVISCLIESFGWFGTEKTPFVWSKILGVGLMIGGIVVYKWK
jgi:transporter family-2 protein